jgi:hypothetical protein
MTKLAKIRKAITAGVVAAAGLFTTGQIVGDLDTLGEWLLVLSAAVIAGWATYQVPNEPEASK